MRSADYTRLAAQLPPLYQDDATSFEQLDAYLGLVDELNGAIVEALEDLPLTLGPDAALRWPYGLPLDAGGAALLQRHLDDYDAVAEWVAYAFPSSWGRDEAGLASRRRFLAKAARLWRRRGTPRGFLDWFCVYFGLGEIADRPHLVEHFKAPGAFPQFTPFTATLFVPSTPAFADFQRRLETAEFARWYAPAHVGMRVCYVTPKLAEESLAFEPIAPLPENPDQAALDAYLTRIEVQRVALDELLCSVVSVVDHANGIHLCAANVPERTIDQLGVGKLPTT